MWFAFRGVGPVFNMFYESPDLVLVVFDKNALKTEVFWIENEKIMSWFVLAGLHNNIWT